MCKCIFGECRKTVKDCEDGKFIYRCGNLNCYTEKIYCDAIQKVLNYDFDELSFSKRSDWDFYKERISNEKNGKACDGCREKITEAFECRCAYLNSADKCSKGSKWGGGKYKILYYQLPVSQSYNGKVDLILREVKTNNIYLTEYKPIRIKSAERLLRMICEIVTYRQSADDGCIDFFNNVFDGEGIKIKKENIRTAIMFNEGSVQHSEYLNPHEGIKELLKKHKINVFEVTKDKNIVLLEEND